MKSILKITIFLTITSCIAQDLDKNSYDFWIGEWDLTWTNAQGQTMKGTNNVIKILDGKVIQESFVDLQNNFKGISLSVYNARKKIWRQAWADNGGGYFNFYGTIEENGDKVFITKTEEKNGKRIVKRMVFKNITKDSLIWDWEISQDDGLTWSLRWRINYNRKK
ncbi:DUF1579 family protein [Hyunsoonleella aestuarii]|uniref:DUF1579 domain-containing protein n=1 Tax=Hyunsoonleella aestuarii TaxID=912802 RepID=A0ABP8E8D2_9FLAO|nr:DUF1579 family protein [Hyunsoonleella aestuarii]